MSETIRVFLAVELPPDVKDALANVVEQLRQADIENLRLVRAEGIHLTLKFLGNISRKQVDSIVTAVSQSTQEHRPFSLCLGATGIFPNRIAPRVLWIGVDGDLESLVCLQKQVDDALYETGFPKEKRSFNPHLTLARIRDGASKADRLKAAQTLFSATVEGGTGIDVSHISLIRSRLLADGAVYDTLASIPLGCGPEWEVTHRGC